MSTESNDLASDIGGGVDGIKNELEVEKALAPESEDVASVDVKFYVGMKASDGYKFNPERSRSFPTLEDCRMRIRDINSASEKLPGLPLAEGDFIIPIAVKTIFYSR